MLDSLPPTFRRPLLYGAAITALAVVTAFVIMLASDSGTDDPIGPTPSPQATAPVLLVPGLDGSMEAFDELTAALEAAGRETIPVHIEGTFGDLRDEATALDAAVDDALAESNATTVDLVAYSSGGVIVRLWAAELGGAANAGTIVTLATPHHGTDAALGGDASCVACAQLATGSDLMQSLNSGDETPAGPQWVTIWSTDDQTVVPPTSADLDGALAFSVQSVCPDASISHEELPHDDTVVRIVAEELTSADPGVPTADVCG